ncbi:MAG: chromosome segregation protein SMC [bacterium]
MKLKRIELQGFKSFVDRTNLSFDQGITAILGPNGCGKSNIVDAVRWVLGEQSPKQLRGDRMDDVIFKGTTKRKPVGLAEVTLTFNNEDRGLNIEFDEVAIKRRVTREGSSEYFLNGSMCRLKDLRDMLYDSGVNNTSYSIIEHAMINQVLNENTQELRRLIEEGSGITKYKARRRETQRKLARTEQDLVRLNDIIEEIGREVRSLKYQVGKARRHQKLFQQIRALDLLVAGRKSREMDKEESAGGEKLQELTTLAESETGELAELRARIEATRPTVDERESERRHLEEALQSYEEELQEAERQVFLLEHRIEEYEARFAKNEHEIEAAGQRQVEVRERISQLGDHLTEVDRDLTAARQELDQRSEDNALLEMRLSQDRGALEQAIQLNLEFIETNAEFHSHLRELQVKQENRQERLQDLAREKEDLTTTLEEATVRLGEHEETRERLGTKRRELLSELARLEREAGDLEAAGTEIQEGLATRMARREALHSRQELLQKMKDEYEGYGQGARKVLQDHAGEERILGSMADRIQVDDRYTAAFETLLAELLDAVVVDDHTTAVSLVDELRQGEIGQASFLCGSWPDAGAKPDLTVPSGGTPARELVTGDGLDAPYLQRMLTTTWVFDTDDQAVTAAASHRSPTTVICLSRSGLLVTSDGVVRGGYGRSETVSLLGRSEKLDKLQHEIDELDHKLENWRQRQNQNRSRREESREQFQLRKAELEILDEDFKQLHTEIATAQSNQASATRRQSELAQEASAINSMLERLVSEETGLRGQLAESGKQRSDSTTRRDELRQLVEEAEQKRDISRSEVEELRLIIQRREGENRETESSLNHLREKVSELASLQERLREEIDSGRSERESLAGDLTSRKEQLMEAFEERERRRKIVRAAADAIQMLHEETAGWHDRAKEIEDKQRECREEMHAIETRIATLDIQRKNLAERIAEQYKGEFRELVRSFDPENLPRQLERDGDVFQLEQAVELLQTNRDQLSSLGPINHLALEEYESKNERLLFLEGQREDVEKARVDLSTAIGRINRTAKKMFMDTFEDVRRNFISVFQVLFEGGHADLQLIRTDDPLESNIHILAQPSGKVVNHVSLLSGGERCLTALSLLFAVYLVKPSPFCMLDEVDAPLDDANIQRFVRMLREFSRNTQFLVVTHNKLTMETANHLYGVTMLQRGVSSIVSVSFHDVAETQSDAELSQAIAHRRREVDRHESVKAILADDDDDVPGMRISLAGRDHSANGDSAADAVLEPDSEGPALGFMMIDDEPAADLSEVAEDEPASEPTDPVDEEIITDAAEAVIEITDETEAEASDETEAETTDQEPDSAAAEDSSQRDHLELEAEQ